MARIETIQNKSGLTYRAHVKCAGIRESATFDTLKEAERWAISTEAAIIEKRHVDKRKAREFTIVDLMHWHLDQFPRSTNRAAASELMRIKTIQKYDISKLTVDKLTRDVVRDWKRERMLTVTEATAKRECSLMKSALNAALSEKKVQLGENPFTCLEWRKTPKMPRIPSTEKMSAIDEAFKSVRNQQLPLAFDFAIASALRKGELVALLWSDINFERRIIRVQRRFDINKEKKPSSTNGTKSRRTDIKIDDMPLTAEMLLILEKIGVKKEGRVFDQLTYNSIKCGWRRIREKVPGVRWHDLRHVAASRYAKALHGNIFMMQKLTRHSSAQALEMYVDVALDDVRTAIDAATA